MKRRPKLLIVSSAAGVLVGLLSAAVVYNLFLPVTLSGRVISRDTGAAVPDALVVVESDTASSLAEEFWDDRPALGRYVKTDKDGRFEARATGSWVSVRAWKPGYAMAGISYGYAFSRRGRDNVVKLREMSPTNWVPEHDDFHSFAPGDGFSFTQGKKVPGDSPEADIIIRQSRDEGADAFIEAQGEGGVIYQPFNDGVDFYNSPAAPSAGYVKRVKVNTSEMGLYFLRTRDGSHFAKFRLMAPVALPPEGVEHLALEETRLIWAYQPDGTRNLEIAPGRGMPFPFLKFGLSVE